MGPGAPASARKTHPPAFHPDPLPRGAGYNAGMAAAEPDVAPHAAGPHAAGPHDNARRRADLARIHVAKARLGLDDATYRAVLKGLAGVDSAALLDARGRARVLAAMREWGGLGARAPDPAAARRRAAEGPSRNAHAGKLRVLWRRMHRAGFVRDGSAEALDAFVLHRTGVAGVGRLTGAQAARVIAALKAWEKRARKRRREAGGSGQTAGADPGRAGTGP
jgi:phage gp16-like protein